MKELVNSVNKIEELILKSLSATDREILAEYISQQLALATNKIVQDGLEKILKQINKGWTDYEQSPAALSVKYFEKNIFTLTPFQYRVAHLQETFDSVKHIFDWDIYPNFSEDKVLVFMVGKVLTSFKDMLGNGVNFLGKPNDDSYYESHVREYELVQKIHIVIVKRDCELLRELFEELNV